MGINTKADKRFCRDMHIYHSKNTKNKSNNQIVNVALDTNTVFNLYKVYTGNPDAAWTNRYIENLKILLNENRRNPDGTFYSSKNKRRFVYWLLPTVQEELNKLKLKEFDVLNKINIKEFYEFINRKMCKIVINPEFILKFNIKVEGLANEYARKNLMKNCLNMPSNDAYIVAESSIFNLPLISNDKDIVGDVHSKFYRPNKENLRRINALFVGQAKNQAEPVTIAQFLNNDKHSKSFEFINSQYLNENLQFMLEEKLECPQTSLERSFVY